MTRSTIVVAGNGMVGHKVVEALLERGAADTHEIVVFGEERRPAYDRVGLSSFFSGATEEELTLVAPDAYKGVDAHWGEAVAGIDRERCVVETTNGAIVQYDALVLATGSYPFVPPVP